MRPRKRPRKAPRPAEPRAVERAYARELGKLTKRMNAMVASFLRASLARAERLDAPAEPFAELDWNGLRARLGRVAGAGANRIVDQYGRRIREHNSRDIASILALDLDDEPPAVKAVLEQWRRENVALITSISTTLHEQVRDTIRTHTQRGTRVETLARLIQGRFAVSESRAKLIARDQVAKANSALTQERHKAAGITRYVWSTSRDERVRATHRELDGRVFSWNDPPVTNSRGDRNHPGRDISCRCVAIPVLDD